MCFSPRVVLVTIKENVQDEFNTTNGSPWRFSNFARWIATASGKPATFAVALFIVIIWAGTGPILDIVILKDWLIKLVLRGSGQAKPESNAETRRNLSNYLYDVGRLLIPCYFKAAQFFCSPSATESGETLKPVVPQLPALVSIQITSPMIPITRIAPTQTPALKISPAISQPARLTIEITRVMDKIRECLIVSSRCLC